MNLDGEYISNEERNAHMNAVGREPVGTIPEKYAHQDHRRIFLSTDNLRKWDTGLYQIFPTAEKVKLTGLEPGSRGAWDARSTEIFGSVLEEDGLFRMWYFSSPEAVSHDEYVDSNLPTYAESHDGIHWEKPDLGMAYQKRYPGNNIIVLPGAMQSVVRALPGSNAKYLAATTVSGPLTRGYTAGVSNFNFIGIGVYIFASDDGFNWRQLSQRAVVQHGDTCSLFADHATGRYFLYSKVGGMHGLNARRTHIGLESRDGIHWEGYEGIATWRKGFHADDYDDVIANQRGYRIADHYHTGMHRVGDTYIGIESMFLMRDPIRPGFTQSWNGRSYLRLAFSDNGFNWRHPPGRPALLEQGDAGETDAGHMVMASTFLEHGDHSLLYYSSSRYPHGWFHDENAYILKDIPLEQLRGAAQIRLARVRKDRFGGLSAPFRATFDVENSTSMGKTSGRRHLDAGPRSGDALFVNVRCPKGSLRVALMENGCDTALPGFGLDDCIPISADSTRATVEFRKAKISQIPPTLGLQLRFELCGGDIFGYEWGER